MEELQRTLVLIKPDGVARCLTGTILHRFEVTGLRLVGLRLLQPSMALAAGHYIASHGQLERMGTKLREAAVEANQSLISRFGTEDVLALGRMIFDGNIEYLLSGPVVTLILEGDNAIEKSRSLCGFTLPDRAKLGTIRGDFSADGARSIFNGASTVANLVHSSEYDAGCWAAKREIRHWYSNDTSGRYL